MTTSPDLSTKPSPSLWHRRLKQVAAWTLGFALLGFLLHKIPLDQIAGAFAMPSATVWAITLAGLLFSYGLRAARLQVVLGLNAQHEGARTCMGLRIDALRVILMHNAAVNLLPMRAGELSFPWLASRELGMPVSRALACLLWMRMQDLAVLLLLGLLIWPGLDWRWRASGLALALAGWLLLNWLLPRIHGSAKLDAKLSQIKAALTEPSHHSPLAWALTAGNWCVKLAAGATLLTAITRAPWLTSWSAALGGELAAVVPLQGPAGFGTYEAGVWAAMAAHLPSQSPALTQTIAAALALHVCFLICAVLAGLGASALGGGKRPALGTNAH